LRRAEQALVKRMVAESLQPWAELQGREARAMAWRKVRQTISPGCVTGSG
jgi:hypothetical protein